MISPHDLQQQPIRVIPDVNSNHKAMKNDHEVNMRTSSMLRLGQQRRPLQGPLHEAELQQESFLLGERDPAFHEFRAQEAWSRNPNVHQKEAKDSSPSSPGVQEFSKESSNTRKLLPQTRKGVIIPFSYHTKESNRESSSFASLFFPPRIRSSGVGTTARWTWQGAFLRSWTILLLLLSATVRIQADESAPPHLNGRHFDITALEEPGFLDIREVGEAEEAGGGTEIRHGRFIFSGYLIDMIEAISQPNRANFTYTLRPPSGFGSMCVPMLDVDGPNPLIPYSREYHTQYNCGASEVHDVTTLNRTTPYTTDIYLGMYYVTPSRQLINQFTIPFLPPFSGTLAMFGTATRIANFSALVDHQKRGLISPDETCGPGGSALIDFVAQSFPGLKIRGLFGAEEEIYRAFFDESCKVYITDGPIAAQFVLRREKRDQCNTINGHPIGVIGDPMNFGLSHYAIGIRQDIQPSVVTTISYWMNILMTCNPLDPDGPCPEGNFASFYEGRGGRGDECGYVLFPPEDTSGVLANGWALAGISIASAVVVLLMYSLWHRRGLAKQRRKQEKRTKAALAQAAREREFNEYMAHEVRNPLASALAALSFVSSKTSDDSIVPDPEHRALILSDVTVINASLQFVNQLLRNLLDLHRTQDAMAAAQADGDPSTSRAHGGIKLNMQATDILRDIFEPISSILFMRGANVKVQLVCPKNLYMTTDRIRLKQILLNLSNNATKFVENGFIRLRAEVVTVPVESRPATIDEQKVNDDSSLTLRNGVGEVQENLIHNQIIVLSVEDSGPGIPPEKRKQLFLKFQDSLDVLNQGTGIGLNVCKNLSDLLGYKLGLDDHFDSGIAGNPGTRFILETNQAPVDLESLQMSHNFHESWKESATGISPEQLPDNLRVLFVDDDTILRKMFSRVLKVTVPSWRVQEASNGETALKVVETETFDIIFVDQYMAAVEKQLLGTETVSAMRAKGVKSIICGLSANDLEERFQDAGANAFMSKPFPCQKDALRTELVRVFQTAQLSNSASFGLDFNNSGARGLDFSMSDHMPV